MTGLFGKGIWLAHSYDFQRAVEMATKIEATHLIVKVGHGPHYFPTTARKLVADVRSLGFHPLAWIHITDRAPQDACLAIRRSVELGYEGTVLYLGKALITANQLSPLVAALEEATAIPASQMFIATPPLPYLPDRQAMEVLAPYCRGGWMPLCFPLWNESAEQIIGRDVYQSISDLSLLWGATPAIYPVISTLQADQAATTFLPEALIPWVENIIQRGVDFFTVYHAAITEKSLWPIIQSARVARPPDTAPVETAPEPGVVAPQPVYVTVTTNDTVGGLLNRHGIPKQKFWAWNAHLWESRGLPRDPDYLQEGWRVRVK